MNQRTHIAADNRTTLCNRYRSMTTVAATPSQATCKTCAKRAAAAEVQP